MLISFDTTTTGRLGVGFVFFITLQVLHHPHHVVLYIYIQALKSPFYKNIDSLKIFRFRA